MKCFVIIYSVQAKGQQTLQLPTGQTAGSIQKWCHVKGHELGLEFARWNTSLKAQLGKK